MLSSPNELLVQDEWRDTGGIDDLNFVCGRGSPFRFDLRRPFILSKPPIDGKWQEVVLQQHRA